MNGSFDHVYRMFQSTECIISITKTRGKIEKSASILITRDWSLRGNSKLQIKSLWINPYRNPFIFIVILFYNIYYIKNEKIWTNALLRKLPTKKKSIRNLSFIKQHSSILRHLVYMYTCVCMGLLESALRVHAGRKKKEVSRNRDSGFTKNILYEPIRPIR